MEVYRQKTSIIVNGWFTDMVEITKIVVKVSGQEIALAIEEARALRDVLEELLGKRFEDSVPFTWMRSEFNDTIIIERI